MKKKEMITYSGEELMQMELPPVRFVVKDFLSQGLNILAGQAKVGKSWMMLDLCIKVAKGEIPRRAPCCTSVWRTVRTGSETEW